MCVSYTECGYYNINQHFGISVPQQFTKKMKEIQAFELAFL